MIDFKQADKFITEKSSKEIFQRAVLYAVWTEEMNNKQYGHDILLTFVAAIGGPFNEKVYKDRDIEELLQATDYGWNNNWGTALDNWAHKHITNINDLNHFQHMTNILKQKSDEIYELLSENTAKGHLFGYYFGPFSMWPRE